MIAVYDDAVVTKDRDDKTTKIVKTHDTDPQGTMGGTAVGQPALNETDAAQSTVHS